MKGILSESYEERNNRARTLGAAASFARNGTAYSYFPDMVEWFSYGNRVSIEFPEIHVTEDIRETRSQSDDRIQKLKNDTTSDQDEWHQR